MLLDQTAFEDKGNCVQAAVASMLGLTLDEVPSFIDVTEGSAEFWSLFKRFLRDRGWEPVMLTGNYVPLCDYLASGKTVRGRHHMVIMNDGRLVHDPHPSRAGLTKVDCIYLLVKKNAGFDNAH